MAQTLREQPCLACRLLNRPCISPAVITHSEKCRSCCEANTTLPCVPESLLTEGFASNFNQCFLELSRGEWLFSGQDGRYWKAIADYSVFIPGDLDWHQVLDYQEHRRLGIATPAIHSPCVTFLKQFQSPSCGSRWGSRYANETFEVLDSAATFLLSGQGESRDNAAPSPLVLALRCLVLSQDISSIADGLKTVIDEGDDHSHTQDAELKAKGKHPSWRDIDTHFGMVPNIDIWRVAAAEASILEEQAHLTENDKLSHNLQQALSATQSLLLRGKPDDWPTALYTISILSLVLKEVDAAADEIEDLREAKDTLERALASLCELYIYCSNGIHPLQKKNSDWEHYALMVGGDELLMQQWEKMHDVLFAQTDDATPNLEDPADFLEYLQLWIQGDVSNNWATLD